MLGVSFSVFRAFVASTLLQICPHFQSLNPCLLKMLDAHSHLPVSSKYWKRHVPAIYVYLCTSKNALLFNTCYCLFCLLILNKLLWLINLQDARRIFSICYSCSSNYLLCYLHDCTLKISISLEQYQLHFKNVFI